MPAAPIRLHLGCGETYLDGYVNVDLSPADHPVQNASPADVHADITTLRYEPSSVAEVRLHHVFEHFDRPTALRVLIDWYEWLEPGGRLMIETPDFEAAVRRFRRPWRRSQRDLALRHVFGSHEAAWAVHADGWYEGKFREVLGGLGFQVSKVRRATWRGTDNITVEARKPEAAPLTRDEQIERATGILSGSLVDGSSTELRLLQVWVDSLSRPRV